MTDITFVRTSHFYDSYQDLLKLVELNDFPVIREYDFDIGKEGVYIFVTMNGDVEAHLTNELTRDALALWSHRILWNLERPPGSAGMGSEYMRRQWWFIHNRYFDEVWVSDQRLADESGLRYVTLGSDERLGEVGTEKNFDFIHLSYETGRRQSIYKYFPAHTIAPNCWGEERHEMLKRTSFGLAVHQDYLSFQEPLRLALFAAYGLPIISESLYNSYPWNDQTIITAEYPELVARMKKCFTEDYEPYRQMGLRARERMCREYQFGRVVRQAVSETVNKWR
jgi:hypothetical protein